MNKKEKELLNESQIKELHKFDKKQEYSNKKFHKNNILVGDCDYWMTKDTELFDMSIDRKQIRPAT